MAEYRRRLPHFHPDGVYLFVTWRLHGSLPVAPADVIYATPGHAFAAQDRALARGHGRRWLSDPRVARRLVEAIQTGESEAILRVGGLGGYAQSCTPVNSAACDAAPNYPLDQREDGQGGEFVAGANRRAVLAG